jgi:hypothetical protein
MTTRDPRIDPRPGDVVQGFDGSQREVVQLWPRALARELDASRTNGELTKLPAGTLISKLGLSETETFTLRVEEAGKQIYCRWRTPGGEPPPLVDAPPETRTVEVEYRSVGEKYSHMVAIQKVRIGLWRGWARGTVVKQAPDT